MTLSYQLQHKIGLAICYKHFEDYGQDHHMGYVDLRT